ncbi:hypothetical protein PC123_g15455 [Phytophthora cactorum]|nr:hypothetical protein PC120_g6313 [Phytophthora cactorum]KAG4049260.1 hypothetical protein PC123_g15455 [Phytophthora cactorum]
MDTINLILVVDGIVAIAGNPSTHWMEGTCVLIAVLATRFPEGTTVSSA